MGVWLVDLADLSSGTTSGSSRLIHGGLRYLEYGELDLVRESLAERGRLLRLAPQFVRPLKLWIPAASRLGGAMTAVGRFFGWKWWPQQPPAEGRGDWLIRAGLALYDAYAHDPLLPKHGTARVPAAGAPPVNDERYGWLNSYYDAQVEFPERLVVGLLHDARRFAESHGSAFEVFTYHATTLKGTTAEIASLPGMCGPQEARTLEPAMIVNATGAWVDETLERLHVPARRLMGGTKGSHLFTFNSRLRGLLAGDGIYAEARDGRPIFITPLGDCVLIGTTDELFEGPPEDAVATDAERDYLLGSVNAILPDATLSAADVDFHTSAVRPLPYVDASTPASITRRHAIVEHRDAPVPLISLVGGKLTTMRSLAEEAAARVLSQLGIAVMANSRETPIMESDTYPRDPHERTRLCHEVARQTRFAPESVAAVEALYGGPVEPLFHSLAAENDRSLVDDTPLPTAFAAWVIRHEHARTLADLVERRLMLLYHQRLTRACLRRLAELLAAAGRIAPDACERAAADEIERLKVHYGKRVE